MYIPDLPQALNSRSIVYLDKSYFTLDASGVVGFFGGEEAVSAMATVHIYKNRRLWGWYNSPGSYEIAKRYGLITGFGFFFGGGHTDPTELLALLDLAGQKGPSFIRVHSGSVIRQTDHLATILMEACECPPMPMDGRRPVRVTIIEMNSCPGDIMEVTRSRPTPRHRFIAAAPIIASAGTCAMCAVIADWYSFSSILLGIIANGLSCFVMGSIELKFMRPQLAGESIRDACDLETPPRVSGILISATNIVLLKGQEDAAMAAACGKFVLQPPYSHTPLHRLIGLCSILLLFQFFAQLVLIPQGSLFGQLMFVTSLAASWWYNLWLCSLDKAKVPQKILLREILGVRKPASAIKGYWLDNWPAMVVFVLLTMVYEDDEMDKEKLKTVLDVLIEETGGVWKTWKKVVLGSLPHIKGRSSVSEGGLDAILKALEHGETGGLSVENSQKLNKLLGQARSGVEKFRERAKKPNLNKLLGEARSGVEKIKERVKHLRLSMIA